MAELLGEIFVRKKLVTAEQLQIALKDQAETGQFLGEILIRLKFTSEIDLLRVLADQFNTRFVELDSVRINPSLVKLVAHNLVTEYKFMPIEMRSGVLLIAVSNPLDMWPGSVLQKKMNLTEVQVVLATKKDIEQTITKHYG